MATITGYTADRMKVIEDSTIVGGFVNTEGELVLTRRDNQQVQAGLVMGEPGANGQPGPAGANGFGLQNRQQTSYVTPSLDTGALDTGDVNFGVAKSWHLIYVDSTRDARIRIYASEAQRDADLGREVTTLPSGNHGVLLDLVLQSDTHWDISPQVLGSCPTGTSSPLTIQNLGSQGSNTVTFTYIPMEL